MKYVRVRLAKVCAPMPCTLPSVHRAFHILRFVLGYLTRGRPCPYIVWNAYKNITRIIYGIRIIWGGGGGGGGEGEEGGGEGGG